MVKNITSTTKEIKRDALLTLCQLLCCSQGMFHRQLMEHLLPMMDDPMVALLTLEDNSQIKFCPPVKYFFDQANKDHSAEVV